MGTIARRYRPQRLSGVSHGFRPRSRRRLDGPLGGVELLRRKVQLAQRSRAPVVSPSVRCVFELRPGHFEPHLRLVRAPREMF
jgi:hypothetical protein